MPRVTSLHTVALSYLAAGRSIVPIAPGSKAPSTVDPRTGRRVLIPWERYQHVHATPDEVRRWFACPQPMGLGIVAGAVSGMTLADGTQAGLEVLDFDDADVHARFVDLVAARVRGDAGIAQPMALMEPSVQQAVPVGPMG